MKMLTRTNKGVQCCCGEMLKKRKQYHEDFIEFVCFKCRVSVFCSFNPGINHIFEDTNCEKVVMIDKN